MHRVPGQNGMHETLSNLYIYTRVCMCGAHAHLAAHTAEIFSIHTTISSSTQLKEYEELLHDQRLNYGNDSYEKPNF